MLKLTSYIEFSRDEERLFGFNYTCNVEINTSWEFLTQTAKIEIPNSFRYKYKQKYVIDEIKRGDKVKIYLGYLKDGINKVSSQSLTLRFVGYVTKLLPGYVVKIDCEDEMWKLKQTVINGYYKSSPCTLKTLINALKTKTGLTFEYDISDTSDLGSIQITPGNSFCDVLEFIKNKYLILAYFKDEKLILKKGNSFTDGSTGTFCVQRNIIGADTMEYQYITDIKLMVKMTSQISVTGGADKKVTRYIYFDSKGNVASSTTPKSGYNQIEHLTSIEKTASELIKEGTEILKSQTYTGYKGEFLSFGEPIVNFGDYAYIYDFKYTDRTGKYLIRAVNITFGTNGYRQKIQIYGKAS